MNREEKGLELSHCRSSVPKPVREEAWQLLGHGTQPVCFNGFRLKHLGGREKADRIMWQILSPLKGPSSVC